MSESCKTCGRWKYSEFHVCPPEWLVSLEGDDWEDGVTVRADYADDAAEDGVERMDDYDCGDSSETTAIVCKPDGSKKQKFLVEREVVFVYRATHVGDG